MELPWFLRSEETHHLDFFDLNLLFYLVPADVSDVY